MCRAGSATVAYFPLAASTGYFRNPKVSGQFAQRYVFAAQCIIELTDITLRVVYLDSLFLAGKFEYMATQQ